MYTGTFILLLVYVFTVQFNKHLEYRIMLFSKNTFLPFPTFLDKNLHRKLVYKEPHPSLS